MEEQKQKENAIKEKPEKKRHWLRKVINVLFVGFIAIQFFQPDKNNNDVVMKNDITSLISLPDTVQYLLKTACYDCHSNNTNYPWYTNIQPVGWWMKNHVDEGKQHLNFNEFTNIPPRNGKTTRERQDKKLEEVKEMIEEDEMPLNSYLWIHKEAELTKEQKQLIIYWSDSARKILKLIPGELPNL